MTSISRTDQNIPQDQRDTLLWASSDASRMSFTHTKGSPELLERIGVCVDARMEVDGRPMLVDLRRRAGLLPMPSEPSHANYPPAVPCCFFAYGERLKVCHTFRRKNSQAKNPVEIEVFIVEVARDLPYFKRRRVLPLCQESLGKFLGTNYFRHEYVVEHELIPKRYTKREMKKLEAIQKKISDIYRRWK